MSTHPPAPPSSAHAVAPSQRWVWLGAAVGAGIPLLALLAVLLGTAAWWFGQLVWSGVAFAGVAFLGSRRTERFGLGSLLGFALLLVLGAGTCTAIAFTA